MTRKHDTRHAPSIRQLEADPRAAYYQAHHDARAECRTTLNLARYDAGRARVLTIWHNGATCTLVARNLTEEQLFFGNIDSAARAALNAEFCRELDCARAALRQPRTYPADKALATRCIVRARRLRLSA